MFLKRLGGIMKVGDLVHAREKNTGKKYIGVIRKKRGRHYKVYFPHAPSAVWNDGVWTSWALEVINENR
jgi:hypothetical protein